MPQGLFYHAAVAALPAVIQRGVAVPPPPGAAMQVQPAHGNPRPHATGTRGGQHSSLGRILSRYALLGFPWICEKHEHDREQRNKGQGSPGLCSFALGAECFDAGLVLC
jgi:hypothetical protein